MNSAPSQSSTPHDTTRLRVWDLPTRVFHWLLLVLVIALIITGHEGGNAMTWHARCGYGVFTLLLFRLVWGLVGGYHSRFVHFIPSLSTLRSALTRALHGPHRVSIGHNPIGALSVVALLMVLGVQVASGLVSDDEIAFSGPLTAQVSASWVSLATWYHKEVGKRLLIGLVLLHVLAIVYYRRRHGERLVTAMVLGDKTVNIDPDVPTPASRDGLRERLLALGCLVACGLIVNAVVQWGSGA